MSKEEPPYATLAAEAMRASDHALTEAFGRRANKSYPLYIEMGGKVAAVILAQKIREWEKENGGS